MYKRKIMLNISVEEFTNYLLKIKIPESFEFEQGSIRVFWCEIWQYRSHHDWGKTLNQMMMDYSRHKVYFLHLIAPNSSWKFNIILHTDNFYIGHWWKLQNSAGVNRHRCCAIREILWSRNRLPKISKL